MNSRGRTCVKWKLSAKDCHSQQAKMDDLSSTKSFHNLHHHRRHQSIHLALPSLQSPEVGYPFSQPDLDPLEQYGSRGEESTTSSSGGKSACNRGLINSSALDGDAKLIGHFDGEGSLGSHFAETLYSVSKKEEVWEDGESCESAADDLYGKGDCYSHANNVFYNMNCSSEERVRRKLGANYNNYGHVSYEGKSETVHNRDANISHFFKQTTSYNKSASGSFSDSSVDFCRTDSRVSENYLGREEDYGSSCGSGEDQLQPAEVEGPWLSVSPSSQTGEGRWSGTADTHTLTSGCPPQRSPIGLSSGMYTQKLDSFSEAFLSQRKIRFPMIPSGESSRQIREFGERRGERQSCAFDSDSYLPPSSSSSPAHSSLLSFPSPPTSSHLMSSVLSPPPTPLPPSSHSPSKMDSPIGGTGHSVSQGAESLGGLQFFAPHLQPFQSVHSSGVIWKFPQLSHCFQQSSGDPSNMEGPLRASHGRDYGNTTALHNIPRSPESSFQTSSSVRSSPHPVRALCPTSAASLHSSPHVPLHPSNLSSQRYEGAEKATLHAVTQKVKNGPASLNQLQEKASPIYTGTLFPSILHSNRSQKRGRYTPRPLLNPVRRGTGLYSCLSSLHHREETACGGDEEECGVLPYVNVSQDFQAELPPCCVDGKGSEVGSPEEELTREKLLWKPWGKLEEDTDSQVQVEKLLSMCSSSCVPGGGSNTELALHCLHSCQGDMMVVICGQTVRTKTVSQCVEFYYLSKKLQDKQKKQKEEESRDVEMEQQKSITPICQPVDRQFGVEEAVPVPSLASFFPCKLCGKMFYKIKSRNAHMKIHRQPQEDWSDRRLQHQILTQRQALGLPNNLMATPGSNLLQPQAPALTFSSSGLHGNSNNADNVLNSVANSHGITPSNASVLNPSTVVTYSNIAASNSHVITNIDGADSNQREPTSYIPFHQSWGSFGHSQNPATFYCSAEAKEDVGAGTLEGKEPINWQ
uniref:uncharacterized protein n=1 Tax=Semicossyphus pulcher TaxID=241346 RepID=UPI0037E98888